ARRVTSGQHLAVRLAHPLEDPLAILVGDHGPDIGALVRRVADDEGFDLRNELGDERIPRLADDEDALDRDAALAGERERVRGELRRSTRRGIFTDDRRRGVPELELDPLAVCAFRDAPSDLTGAGERDQL